MPYCYNCGVKLDDDATICPLCGAKIPVVNKKETESFSNNKDYNFEKEENKKDNSSLYPIYDSSTSKQKLTSIIEIISVSFIICILSLVLINFILEGKITWSKIPSVTIFFSWLIIASSIVFQRKILYSIFFIFISIFGYLISLDSLNKDLGWSINFGLPILISVVIISILLYFLILKTRQKGLNLVAYFLLAGNLLCFSIDIIIGYNLLKIFIISWSKYVSFAVIPLSFFLLYLHHRFAKKLPAKRTFRI